MEATPNWNIDRLCANEQAMKEADEHWRELSEGRVTINACSSTTTGLEAEACWIQNSLRAVLDKHAPGRPSYARSKRWWTDDIKQQRRLFGRARRDYNHDRISFVDYRLVRNDYYRYIRKDKRLAWNVSLKGPSPATKGQT